ncbi:MAG: FAD-dependent oxidoreductase [Anaerolineae bacterium]|nr:FAD-dependent oxidoreductase [Anaerolineae bacterium]
MQRIVVIGAGVGGLAAAAALARAGLDVTVLEAHVDPGGCAATFFHQGYRFEAGATLAGGFYPGGPMDLVAQAAGIDRWPVRPANPALVVHLPDGAAIPRVTGPERPDVHREAFGPAAAPFWAWQERTADALWALALRLPPWPPQTPAEALDLVGHGLGWLAADPARHLRPGLLADAFRPVAAHLRGMPDRLRLFVDAQLLIAAQATSQHANALYGASALDLPRRGVVHLEGGIGRIAEELAAAVRRSGGQVMYRQEVTRIVREGGRVVGVETKRGEHFPADTVIANLPPWNIAALLGEHDLPGKLKRLTQTPPEPQDGWGAFVMYVGLDGGAVPEGWPLHHQVVVREPLGEANTVFLSLSPAWDASRAPAGQRALTISTHTDLRPWWRLYEQDRAAYDTLKDQYADRLLDAAARVLPELRAAAGLVMPGTPVTFQRFTRRAWGWVGGFPQTSLLRAWGPRIMPEVWMVGDSIFPGQSTAAVALGGLRVARALVGEVPVSRALDDATRPVMLK